MEKKYFKNKPVMRPINYPPYKISCRNCKYNIPKEIPSLDLCIKFKYAVAVNQNPAIYEYEFSSTCREFMDLCSEYALFFEPK
jgi:hypothetical protein